MRVLKPLTEGQALTFCHIAGEVLWRSAPGKVVPIDRQQAEILREIYVDECRAAWRARDRKTSRHAAGLWTQLTQAIQAQDTWFRVIGREPERKAA